MRRRWRGSASSRPPTARSCGSRGADAAALDRGVNLALVGDELLQFGVAEQLRARRWRLRELWRGRRGTAAAAHATGDRFVLIEAESALVVSLAALPGQAARVAAEAAGDAAEIVAVLSGASILPPAPVALAAVNRSDGGATINWRRRARTGWRWRDGADDRR